MHFADNFTYFLNAVVRFCRNKYATTIPGVYERKSVNATISRQKPLLNVTLL